MIAEWLADIRRDFSDAPYAGALLVIVLAAALVGGMIAVGMLLWLSRPWGPLLALFAVFAYLRVVRWFKDPRS